VEKLTSAIEMPHFGIERLRHSVTDALRHLSSEEKKIIIFSCSHGVGKNITKLKRPGVAGINVECSGMLPPAFIDYALRQGADGVLLTGCRDGDCYHRLGNEFARQRLNGERKPELHRKVAREKVRFFMGAETDGPKLNEALDDFSRDLTAGGADENRGVRA